MPALLQQPALEAVQKQHLSKLNNTVVTGIPEVPVTLERPVPTDFGPALKHPHLPRATLACCRELPNGLDGRSPSNRTVIQQHVDFFDFDKDGVIWPWDTYIGFRKMGFGRFWAAMNVPFLHGVQSYPTQPGWLPHPLFAIYTDNIHRGKHGGDSEVFDTEGRFVPQKFETLFAQFDKEGKGGLSASELIAMANATRNVNDSLGWIAMRGEWLMTWLLAADENGVVSKERALGVYDGSLFYRIADEVAQGRVVPRRTPTGTLLGALRAAFGWSQQEHTKAV